MRVLSVILLLALVAFACASSAKFSQRKNEIESMAKSLPKPLNKQLHHHSVEGNNLKTLKSVNKLKSLKSHSNLKVAALQQNEKMNFEGNI